MKNQNEIYDVLLNLDFFKFFKDNPERLGVVVKYLKYKKFKKGDIVIEEDEIGDSLYIIKKGTVRIEKKTFNNDRFTVIVLKDKEHVFFGEISLLRDAKRTATVICEEDSEFLILNRVDFNKICEEDNYIGMIIYKKIANILAERLIKADQDIITLFNALVQEIEEG